MGGGQLLERRDPLVARAGREYAAAGGLTGGCARISGRQSKGVPVWMRADQDGTCSLFLQECVAREEFFMNALSLAVFLALAAFLLGVITLVVFYVVVNRERKTNSDQIAADRALSARPDAASSTPSQPRSGSHRQHKKKGIERSQRYLFVVFDEPGPAANRALGQLLSEVKAFYEAGLGIYHVPPGPEGYPLTVANASSPGKLPPLHLGGDEHPPVQGVSILIKFINSRSVSRNPETLIAFTYRVAEIGGRILDVERKPVTEETFAELRGDAE
jgi:hypothetical protein